MPDEFIFVIPKPQQTNQITTSHFGLNFVSDFERIGSKSWETFDNVAAQVNAGNLRYPGGVTAEQGFDITNPNAGTITLSDGATRKTLGAYDFGQFCLQNGYSASYIIPTFQLLERDPDTGSLVFLQSFGDEVVEFVYGTLVATDGHVAVFEIGNEYESGMTSQEYGALVDELAPLIQQGIDSYTRDFGVPEIEPEIAIQVWSQNSNETGTLTTADLDKRADGVFSQLSDSSIDLIDSVVTHWYLKDRGRSYEQAYSDIEDEIQSSIGILDNQAENFGGDVNIIVSEYNVNHKEVQFFGMAQVPMLICMFAEFVQAGVDQLDFWSAQYQSTSFALDDGTLTAVGAAVTYLSEVLPGLEPFDVETGSTSIGSVYFAGDELSVLTISNLSDDPQSFSMLVAELDTANYVVQIGYLATDQTDSDGKYKTYDGLNYYNEPDLPGDIYWVSGGYAAADLAVYLDPYQTIFIEMIDLSPDLVVGASGKLSYSFSESTSGVAVWIAEGVIEMDVYQVQFDFAPGYEVQGTQFSDWITLSSGKRVVNTGSGNDYVEIAAKASGSFSLGSGNDMAVVDADRSSVVGGKGDDVIGVYGDNVKIQGGQGNDTIILTGHGSKIIYSLSDGDDVIDATYLDDLVLKLSSNAIADVHNGMYEVIETSDSVTIDFINGGSLKFLGASFGDISDQLFS